MKKILFLLLVCTQVVAQKKNFTMKEAVLGLGTTFAVENLKQLKWMGNSDYFAQAISNENIKCIIRTNASTMQVDTFMHLAEYNAISNTKLTAFPPIEWIDENSFMYNHLTTYLVVKKQDGRLLGLNRIEFQEGAEDIHFSTEWNYASCLEKNRFRYRTQNTTNDIADDASENIIYGKAVHRDEFGITTGTFWSPKSNYIAFYRMDQSMVEDYPIIDWVTSTPASFKTIKYPFAGRTSHEVRLGVRHRTKGDVVYLETGEPKDQYLTTVTWSPDEKYIYLSLLNREQNHLALNKYDVTTGKKVQTLFEEKHEKYVEPQHPLEFFNNDPNQFVWWSQRDGFMHLYHYNSNGKLIKQLTKGNWVVNELLGFSSPTNELVFTSSKDNPMQKNVFAVNTKSGKMRTISKTLATHTTTMNKNGTFLLDQYTSSSIPRNIDLVNIKSGETKSLLSAKATLTDFNMSTIEDIKLTASNGVELYAKFMKPSNFDMSKKYPVIVYLYNGPHVQLNKDTYPYSGNLWYDYLTQNGYLVFVLDGRGSANRGFDFESAIHRQLGEVEMDDQMKGIEYLKKQPFVDAERMGIHGWSYGGFMTTSFMLRKPDVFKCGVAGGPVLDWSLYEIMYGERYMDMPKENPEGYAANLLLDKTKNLKGKLLMIHGADDDVVVWQHSMKFVKKCVDEGVQLDYFVYPGHPHNVRGKDRVHLMQKITDYFDEHLK